MLAISFHLILHETEKYCALSQAYQAIDAILTKHGFEKMQENLYANPNENLANLFDVMNELKTLDWFAAAVGNIHAFRMTQWSDFTASVKSQN